MYWKEIKIPRNINLSLLDILNIILLDRIMSMTAVLFGFAMIDNILLLLINIFNVSFLLEIDDGCFIECIQIITLSDLETDLMNVRSCCEKLNQVRID